MTDTTSAKSLHGELRRVLLVLKTAVVHYESRKVPALSLSYVSKPVDLLLDALGLNIEDVCTDLVGLRVRYMHNINSYTPTLPPRVFEAIENVRTCGDEFIKTTKS